MKASPRTDASLVLRENQDGAIAQQVRAIALREHISYVEQSLNASRAFVTHANRLAKMKVQIRVYRVDCKRRYLGDRVFRLPAIARAPLGARALQSARKRESVGLHASRMGCADHLRKRHRV